MPPPLPPEQLRCEWQTDPLGIDVVAPRLSWLHSIAGEAWLAQQLGVQVQVASSAPGLAADAPDIWDSGRVPGAEQHMVYGGPPLVSRQRYFWRVRAWGHALAPSDWSNVGWWEMGLLTSAEWRASWIYLPHSSDTLLDPCQYLRRTFIVARPLTQARLYITARGLYEASVNGQRVGTAYLTPGWTDYDTRLQYQVYDVTELLTPGENALGVVLGSGWYSGHVSNIGPRHYGATPQLLAQLALTGADGTTEWISSDHEWQGAEGPLRTADLLQGTTFDAHYELPGWDQPYYDQRAWQPVTVLARHPMPQLVAERAQPIQVTETRAPQRIRRLDATTQLVDFGQNLVGWVRLSIPPDAEAVIHLRHAEILDGDGFPYYANLRSARQTDSYIPRAQGHDAVGPSNHASAGAILYEPKFTVHGFRYVAVQGYPHDLTGEDICACVVGSNTPRIGSFASGHPLVNQLHSNILWSQRGNFLSVPTDCPQRDERMGWLGDAQVFVGTAAYNMDVAAFFTKWMGDVRDGQLPNGAFPNVAPRVVVLNEGAPGWGDAGVIIPWTMYRMYGDRDIVRQSWDAMTRWMRYLTEANPSGLRQARNGDNYGDWLAVDDAVDNHIIATRTPKDLLATAYYARTAEMMAELAEMLEHHDEAADYRRLHQKITAAFQAAYIDHEGRIAGATQTAYVLALAFDLVPPDVRALSARHLVDDLAARGWHLATGFLGVGYLLPVLTACGYDDIAYRLLVQETYPSWGYSIRQGATTIWERWDGWTQERGFQDPAMNSFNHYSLGSVGEWLYRSVGGIESLPTEAGMGRVRLHPHPSATLGWAAVSWRSPFGEVQSRWAIEKQEVVYACVVPPNMQATVVLSGGAFHIAQEVLAMQLAVPPDALHVQGDMLEFTLPAGRFTFRVPLTLAKDVSPV